MANTCVVSTSLVPCIVCVPWRARVSVGPTLHGIVSIPHSSRPLSHSWHVSRPIQPTTCAPSFARARRSMELEHTPEEEGGEEDVEEKRIQAYEALRAWVEQHVEGRRDGSTTPITPYLHVQATCGGCRASVLRTCVDAPPGEKARPKVRRAVVALAWNLAVLRRTERTARVSCLPSVRAFRHLVRREKDGRDDAWKKTCLASAADPLLRAAKLRRRGEALVLHVTHQFARWLKAVHPRLHGSTTEEKPCEAHPKCQEKLLDAMAKMLWVLEEYEKDGLAKTREETEERDESDGVDAKWEDKHEDPALSDAIARVEDAVVAKGKNRLADAWSRKKEEAHGEIIELMSKHAAWRAQRAVLRRDQEAYREAAAMMHLADAWRKDKSTQRLRLRSNASLPEWDGREDGWDVLQTVAAAARGWLADREPRVESWDQQDNQWWLRQAKGIAIAKTIRLACQTVLEKAELQRNQKKGRFGKLEDKQRVALTRGLVSLVAMLEATKAGSTYAHAAPHAACQAQARARKILEELMHALQRQDKVARRESNGQDPKSSPWGILSRKKGVQDEEGRYKDAEALLCMARETCIGPPTDDRRAVLSVTLDMLRGLNVLEGDTSAKLQICELEIQLAAEGQSLFEQACDTSFLLDFEDLSETILTGWYRDTLNSRTNPESLRYLILALRGPESTMKQLGGELGDAMAQAWSDRLEARLLQCIIHPFYEDVEADLRLHLHASRLNGAVEANPGEAGLTDLSMLVHASYLPLHRKDLSIERGLVVYLTQKFHSHVAVARSSWLDYTEMIALCKEKYGIELPALVFPPHAPEPGHQLRMVMDNLGQFLLRNSFSFTTHSFYHHPLWVGTPSNEETLSASQVNNVLRTRGFGILQPLLEESCSFVQAKVSALACLLSEKGIKARIQRENRLCREHKVGGVCKYQYQKGELFYEDLQRIKVAGGDRPAIEELRTLLTELGNAMAFIRLLRLGALRRSQECASFLSANQNAEVDISGLSMLAEDSKMSQNGVKAFSNLESCAAEVLGRSGSEGVAAYEYLELVASRVIGLLGETRQDAQMSFFYLCVPVASIMHIKGLMESRVSVGNTPLEEKYAEDGFALGTMFMLQVLRQVSAFRSLGWFHEVRNHHKHVLLQMKERVQLTDPRSIVDESQSVESIIESISGRQEEFTALEQVMECAQGLFAIGQWHK